MSQISFRLEAFEGPLDLLLELINRHKLNIYDIEISILLDQYMEYIDGIEESDLDSAGEFLAMAARLVYIKTCSLLPKAEEAQQLKKELEGELIEYSVCKAAAARLKSRCVYGEVFVRPPEKLPINKVFTGVMPPESLLQAYMGMTAKARRLRPPRAEQFSPIVAKRIVTVTSKIVYVLKKLYKCGECLFSELYTGIEQDRSAKIATFLAVLELTRSGRIRINEDNSIITFNRNAPRRHHSSEDTQKGGTPADISESADVSDAISYEISADETAEDNTPDNDKDNDESEEYRYDGEKKSAPKVQRTGYIGAVRSNEAVLAVPVFAVISSPQPNETMPQENIPQELPAEQTYMQFDELEEYEDITRGKVGEKINRYPMRFYWGCPDKRGNCWKYRRWKI